MKNFLANIAAAAMGLAILVSVVQAWLDGLDSKVWVTLGAALLAAGVVLAWKRISATTRPLLVGTGFVILVGALSLHYGPSATSAYRIGDLSLSGLVNLLILASGAVALVGSLRQLPTKPRVRMALGGFGALCLAPFAYGLATGASLSELLAGPGPLYVLPVYGRPAVLAILVLLPVSVVVLARDLLAARRDDDRESLAPLLLLFCALVPLAVGVSALLGTGAPGLALRTFSDHSWDSLHSQSVSPEPKLSWEEPPAGLPSSRFWMEWEGTLQVQQSGLHRFGLFGEGATGHVYVDGYLATNGLGESDYIPLELGPHRIRVGLIAKAPSGSFALRWTTPAEGDFVPITRALMTHEAGDLEWRRSPRQAAQVGLEWLQSSALHWQRYNHCFGCHVQAQALMGMSIGEDSGYEINDEVLEELEQFVRKEQSADGSWHDQEHVAATQFGAMALAWLGRDREASSDKDLREGLELLISKQEASGEFAVDMREVPIVQGSMMTTSNTLFALRAASESEEASSFGAAADTAFEWLLQAEVNTTQDATMQLLSISREAPALPLKASRMEQILSLQQRDGGWKEAPVAPGSGAFSTGQVLYGLKVAGQAVDSSEFGDGVRFLMERQQVSGEWKAMHTLSARRSDFAPTMWAVIGLAGSYDKVTPDVVAPRVESPTETAGTSPETDVAVPVEVSPDGPVDTPLDVPVEPSQDVPVDVLPDGPVESPPQVTPAPEPVGLALELLYPVDGMEVSGSTPCKVRLHATEGTPLQLVGFYLGTEQLAERAVSAESGWSELELDCDLRGYAPGDYELTVVVQDRSSNRAMVQRALTIVARDSEAESP